MDGVRSWNIVFFVVSNLQGKGGATKNTNYVKLHERRIHLSAEPTIS
jgi:hypothetical protein